MKQNKSSCENKRENLKEWRDFRFQNSFQKTFLLHLDDSAFDVVFEEGLLICTNNPVSAKFSVNVILTVKGIPLLAQKFPRDTQCRVQEIWLVLTDIKEEGL